MERHMIQRKMYLECIRLFLQLTICKSYNWRPPLRQIGLTRKNAHDLIARGVPEDDITLISLEKYENRALLDCDELSTFI